MLSEIFQAVIGILLCAIAAVSAIAIAVALHFWIAVFVFFPLAFLLLCFYNAIAERTTWLPHLSYMDALASFLSPFTWLP